ncbi:outer membrane beta-barrel protein [uncultured Photobacterium sp.]|uniref:outer membrane beta-barrel protein n=1 Tax=uncultured Photobacterium sp. TaxID=173973 RepID=UPI0026233B83|nr:outer membrane beta-barrel protein [uncultured Photobacterium sp.]
MFLFKMKNIHLLLVSYLCITYSLVVNADSTFQESKHIDSLLGLEFSSSINAGYGFDDNVFNQHDDHIIGSDFYFLNPSMSIIGKRNTKDFGFYYFGNYQKYNNDVSSYRGKSDQNYKDHNLTGIFTWELGFRHHLELLVNYDIGHEALGTGVTNGFYFSDDSPSQESATFDLFNITRPIEKINKKANVKYIYGAKGAKGNLVFDLSQERLDYDILSSYTSAFNTYLNDENMTETDANVTFKHQYTDRTRFDYKLIYKKYNYRDYQRDNDELITALSFISQITGKSKIEATVSRVQKTMQSSDFSGVNWNVSYKWQPADYSTLFIQSKSEVKEPENTGDFVQSFENSITWDHQFLANISSHLSYKNLNDSYHIRDRKDKYHYFDLRLSYLFRPKIEVNFDYRYALFYSSLNTDAVFINEKPIPRQYIRNLGYEKNQFSLSVKVAI